MANTEKMIKIKCLKPNADAIFEMDYCSKYDFHYTLMRKSTTKYRGAVLIADYQGNVRFIATLSQIIRVNYYDNSREWVFINIKRLKLDTKITRRSTILFDVVLGNMDKSF